LCRCAIDLVGEEKIGEDRPLLEFESARGIAEETHARDIGRHEIRGELDAAELDAERRSEHADEEGLGRSRPPLGEEVSTREVGNDRIFDCAVLPDDATPDSFLNAVEEVSGLRKGHFDHARGFMREDSMLSSASAARSRSCVDTGCVSARLTMATSSRS